MSLISRSDIYNSKYIENTDIPAEIRAGWGCKSPVEVNDVFLNEGEKLPNQYRNYNLLLESKILANYDRLTKRTEKVFTDFLIQTTQPCLTPLSARIITLELQSEQSDSWPSFLIGLIVTASIYFYLRQR